MQNIQIDSFGTLPDGTETEKITLTGRGGLSASFLTYGATVQAIVLDGLDLVQGYDTLDGYLGGDSCQGASIGRYGNRIADGKFTLNGKEYTLARNELGTTHLHGGDAGFDKRVWNAEPIPGNEPAVRFSRLSPDGEEGYPGNLQTTVTYQITADNALHITYTGICDQDTHYNPTCHAYFNLNGCDGSDVCSHILTLHADKYLPVDKNLIPTGELADVAGTPFDFRAGKPVGQDLAVSDPQLAIVGQGYDHNWILTGAQPFAVLTSPVSGITMECFTDQPGVQFYSAVCLCEPKGKNGYPLKQYQAVCLETQHFPDSPNHPEFPTTVLPAGKQYKSETVYRFFRGE